MTTKFDSFDASPLGAFTESPLGARNAPRLAGTSLTVLIVWIDEAKEIYADNPDQYFAHKAEWETALGTRDGDRVLALLWDAPFDDPLLPSGAALPIGVEVRSVARSLSGEGILNQLAFDVPEGRRVRKIRIAIDTSGSFAGWPRLEDAVVRFFVLARERWGMGGVDNTTVQFTEEDWVLQLTRGLERLLP